MTSRTPSAGRRESDGLAAHLLRVAGLTLACTALAALVAVAALRMTVADQPDPWHAVQVALAGAFAQAAPIVAAFLAGGAALGALLLAGIVLWTIGARARGLLRPRPERTTEGRESP